MGYWPVVKKVVKNSDIVLEVIDVRFPEMARNATLEKMVSYYGKKLVRVFNKIDIASEDYLRDLRREYKNVFFVSGARNIGIRRLRTGLLIMAKRMKIESPKIGIVGYPNGGKSAIINALAKSDKARVSERAGTTKGIQWIKAGSLLILDSPGVVPLEDYEVKLGIMGAKNPEKLKNAERVAFEIIKMFVSHDREALERIYGINLDQNENVLELIGKKKGFLYKGGVVDERRAALLVIKDWQKGKLRL